MAKPGWGFLGQGYGYKGQDWGYCMLGRAVM